MASAALYHHERDWKHTESVFREIITEVDMTLQALNLALDVLTDFLTSHQLTDPLTVSITSLSNFAITMVLNTTPHEEQNITIGHLEKLGKLMTAFPQMNFPPLWLPRTIPFVSFKRAKQLALEAIRTAEPNPGDDPHTIKHQKKKTKEAAILLGLAAGTSCHMPRWHTEPPSLNRSTGEPTQPSNLITMQLSFPICLYWSVHTTLLQPSHPGPDHLPLQ
jgi:hypothetical protein